MNSFPRIAYRLILQLHPASFQREFADEMLWIFDEESRHGASAPLLFDGLFSLIRQHSKMQPGPAHSPVTSSVLLADPGLGPWRLLQGSITSSMLVVAIMFLMGQPIPTAVTATWQHALSHNTILFQPHSLTRHP